jgi:hypothetical protein
MSTWTEQKKYSGQTPITYNEATITYNQLLYVYNGIKGTLWTEQQKF